MKNVKPGFSKPPVLFHVMNIPWTCRILGHEFLEVSMDYDMEVEKAIGRASKCFPVFVKISIPSQVWNTFVAYVYMMVYPAW